MGKRIPGKKRKGYLDLALRNSKRELVKSRVLNDPPSNVDDQPVCRSMFKLSKLIKLTQEGFFDKDVSAAEMDEILIDERYKQANPIFDSYSFSAKRRSDTKTKEETEIEESTSNNSNGKTKSTAIKNKFVKKGTKKLRNLKKHDISDKSDEELEEFTVDQVSFGETVHAPPQLKTFPKSAKKSKLWSSRLVVANKLDTSKSKEVDITKIKQEQIRQEVVETYRKIKADRRKQM